ncbi:hypothetical protein CSIM01_11507, partial [Colletotrichum simmondsii]
PASLPYASASASAASAAAAAASAAAVVAVTVAFPCCGLSHLHLAKARIGLRNLQYLQDTSPSQVRPAVQPTSSLASASELKLLFNPLPGPSTQMPKAQVKTKTPTAHACPYIDTFFAQKSRHLEINDCNLAGGPPAVAAAPTTAPSPSWKYSSSSLPHGTDLLKPAGYNRRYRTTHIPLTDTWLRLYRYSALSVVCTAYGYPTVPENDPQFLLLTAPESSRDRYPRRSRCRRSLSPSSLSFFYVGPYSLPAEHPRLTLNPKTSPRFRLDSTRLTSTH